MSKPRFQPSLAAAVATLVVMAVCARLGLWQLERAAQKSQWQAQISERAATGAQSLDSLLAKTDAAHYPVRFTGSPDNSQTVLLDNRVLDGVAGYHVLTPVSTPQGPWVLVNRGWIPRGRDRQQLPSIAPLPDPVTVEGTSYIPGQAFTLEAPATEQQPQWPLRVQSVDMDRLATLMGKPLAPFEVRVPAGYPLEQDEQMRRVWHDSRLGAERHRAYAVQWFAMAAAVLVVFLFASVRRHRPDNELDA